MLRWPWLLNRFLKGLTMNGPVGRMKRRYSLVVTIGTTFDTHAREERVPVQGLEAGIRQSSDALNGGEVIVEKEMKLWANPFCFSVEN